MEKKDYYKILGVSKDASDESLKKAYRKLSMQLHPDRQVGKTDAEKKEAEEKFKDVNEAYSVLSDKDKRARYDQFGSVEGMSGFDGFGNGPGGFDPFEFFRQMHTGFGDDSGFSFGHGGFSFSPGNNAGRTAPDVDSPEDGADIRLSHPVHVTFKESVFGTKKEFDLELDTECTECGGRGIKKGTSFRECPHCHGRGQIVHRQGGGMFVSAVISPCRHCSGTGYEAEKCEKCSGERRVAQKRHIKVTVPKGVQDGTVLRLKEMGQCGIRGGKTGSLYIPISVEKSDIFVRDENDLFLKAYVSPTVASLGGNIDIPTPYGYKSLTINPGTQTGTKLKITGAGIKTEDGQVGDMNVVVLIESYSDMTSKQKSLMKQMLEAEIPSNFPNAAKLKAKADAFYA